MSPNILLTFACSVRWYQHRRVLPTACTASQGKGVVAAVEKELPAALPGYTVVRVPHLRDYLGDLESITSPLLSQRGQKGFIKEDEVVLKDIVISQSQKNPLRAFVRAGPREDVYFEQGVRAAIVSCGGICPGINTVIRELTLCLNQYHAETVFGVQHG